MLQINRRLVSLAVILAAWFALGWSSALAAERVYFYHTDAAGTPLAITNTNGKVVWETDYLPFGEPSTVTAQIKNTTMFAGKEHDAETGLYDFGARYLAADVGRFFAPDPVRAVDPVTSQVNSLLIQNPQRLNLYAYGLNNPYRFIDPDGNIVWDIVDLAFFSYSYYRFVDDPSLSTGIDVALDGIGLLPVVPALGTIKRVGQEGLEQVAKLGAQRAVTKGADGFIDLTAHRKDHILNRHRAGAGKPGKTEFPAEWSDEKILHHVSDIATDPNAVRGVGKWDSPYAIGTRDGIKLRVDFYPNNHPKYAGQISSAYPINVPANP